jgi:hypothetical protein
MNALVLLRGRNIKISLHVVILLIKPGNSQTKLRLSSLNKTREFHDKTKVVRQETRLKISCKRWSDVDFVVDRTMNPYYGFGSRGSNISKDLQDNLTPFMQDN